MLCKNEENGVALKFNFNPLTTTSFFTIEFESGLPESLLTLTEDYCKKIQRGPFGNKDTRITCLYFKNDTGDCNKYFCQYFQEVENYFSAHFEKELPFLSDNGISKGFDELRRCMSLPENTNEKNIRQRFRDLEKTIQQYSLLSLKVRHGIFAGQLPRNIRDINIELDKIKNQEFTMKHGLKNIIQIAQQMGNQHPILQAAKKCSGLISNDLQSHLIHHRM